jgi:hypothetical protein
VHLQTDRPRCWSTTGAHTRRQRAPGPGSYNDNVDLGKAFKPVHMQQSAGGFQSQQPRFQGQMAHTPGPGTYVDPSKGTMVKRSYNVTVQLMQH